MVAIVGLLQSLSDGWVSVKAVGIKTSIVWFVRGQ